MLSIFSNILKLLTVKCLRGQDIVKACFRERIPLRGDLGIINK